MSSRSAHSSRIGAAARRVAVGTLAAGVLSIGAVGLAGTAGAATVPAPKAGHHINCANADKVLARIQKGEANIAAGLPKLTAAEAKAKAAGHTKRADRLQKRITRLESSTFKARLTKATQKIETACPGSSATAPSTSTATS